MFNLFKKENNKTATNSASQATERKIVNEKDEDLFDDKTVIYSMPEKFRFPHMHANNAKIAGFLILAFGFLFLIGASFAVYYYLIKKPAANLQPNENNIDNTAPTSVPSETPVASTSVENPVTPKTVAEPAPVTTLPIITETASTTISTSTGTIDELTATNTASATATITENNFKVAPDQDQDGLSDQEETIIGTDSDKKDSDGDGYNDLAELNNFYNPAGTGKLDDNHNIAVYENKNSKYRFYYPTAWRVNEESSDMVIIQAPDNSFVQINTVSNKELTSLPDWYLAQTKETLAADRAFEIGNWPGIKSRNGVVEYLMSPQKDLVYVFSYNPGADKMLYYQNIFSLVINSLIVSMGN
jgi:hypothetical protein